MGIIKDIRDLYNDYKYGDIDKSYNKKFEEWDNDEERLRYYQ